ncbi:MAG: ThuA domain-containing protein [Bacteroidota bacterium]
MLANILFKKIFILMALAVGITLQTNNGPADSNKEKKILVFAKTNGYHHESIADGIVAIMKLGQENKFAVDSTTDSLKLNDDNLKQYKVIVFLSTTGKVLGDDQEKALQNFMRKGGGWVGIHAAADCEYNWPWYNKLCGGWFKSHPKQQQAKLQVIDKTHLSTKHLPDVWERWDEWYNYKDLNPDVHVLIKIDETSYTGGENNGNHPMAWYHDYEGGKAFYTEMGHTKESFVDPVYLQHILGGIEWAMGKK